MSDPPFIAIAVTEALCTSHEENSPSLEPLCRVLFSIDPFHDGHDGSFICILIAQPGVTRLFVMGATPPPMLYQLQVLLVTVEQSIAWHHATSEEVVGHPILRTVTFIGAGLISMTKDVAEELAVLVKPA